MQSFLVMSKGPTDMKWGLMNVVEVADHNNDKAKAESTAHFTVDRWRGYYPNHSFRVIPSDATKCSGSNINNDRLQALMQSEDLEAMAA